MRVAESHGGGPGVSIRPAQDMIANSILDFLYSEGFRTMEIEEEAGRERDGFIITPVSELLSRPLSDDVVLYARVDYEVWRAKDHDHEEAQFKGHGDLPKANLQAANAQGPSP